LPGNLASTLRGIEGQKGKNSKENEKKKSRNLILGGLDAGVEETCYGGDMGPEKNR